MYFQTGIYFNKIYVQMDKYYIIVNHIVVWKNERFINSSIVLVVLMFYRSNIKIYHSSYIYSKQLQVENRTNNSIE